MTPWYAVVVEQEGNPADVYGPYRSWDRAQAVCNAVTGEYLAAHVEMMRPHPD